MAKDWVRVEKIEKIFNITPMEVNDKKFNKLIRNTKTLSVEDLKKEANDLHEANETKENSLIVGLDNNLLKSEKAIKEATRIKKMRERDNNKKKNAET